MSAQKKSKKSTKPKRSALQSAGAKFVDELGSRAIESLKSKLGLNTELHVVDVSSGATSLGTTLAQLQGAITVPQGNTNQTRLGDSFRVVDYIQNLSFRSNGTTSATAVCRVIGVANRHNAPATTPAPGVILQDPTDVLSPMYAEFADSGLEVIFDWTDVVSAQSLQIDVDAVKYKKYHWRPSDFHVSYTQGDTTGVQADLVQGGMYVYAMYGLPSNGTITAVPRVTITSRLTFVDN